MTRRGRSVARIYDTEVVYSFRFEGFHRWPDAPDKHAYLRDRHRHEFHVRCWRTVSHDDREVEIIEAKRDAEQLIRERFTVNDSLVELGGFSCEMLARYLCNTLGLSACEVLEDGENGATVRRITH